TLNLYLKGHQRKQIAQMLKASKKTVDKNIICANINLQNSTKKTMNWLRFEKKFPLSSSSIFMARIDPKLQKMICSASKSLDIYDIEQNLKTARHRLTFRLKQALAYAEEGIIPEATAKKLNTLPHIIEQRLALAKSNIRRSFAVLSIIHTRTVIDEAIYS